MVNKFTNIKERVVEVAESQGVSKEQFFRSIGMTSASFRGKAKDSPLNSNAVANIITKYPDVDIYWLLTGEKEDTTVNVLNEPRAEYKTAQDICKEKDEIIKVLKSQIKDLKTDKEDLKKLLGLAKGKK